MTSLETGQWVRFDKPHASMSHHLRRLAGQVGKVIAIGEGVASDKVLVDFGETHPFEVRRWWVNYSELKQPSFRKDL